MSWVMAGVAVAGLVAGGIGAAKKGKDSSRQRRSLEEAANMPGINVGNITQEALATENQFMPEASRMANLYSQANQSRLNAQEEMALPGAGASRAKDLEAINRLFADDKEWLTGVQRRGAALGIGRGLGGSPAAQIGTLKLSDTEQMDRTRTGTGLLAGLLGTLRLAPTPGLEAFLPTTNTLLDIRSRERSQRQQLLGAAAGIPGMGAAMGGFLQQTGGIALGAGLGGVGRELAGTPASGSGASAIPEGGYRVNPNDQFNPQSYMNQWPYAG